MKKTLLSSLMAAMVAMGAYASDGGVYRETETWTTHVRYNISNATTVAAPAAKPQCGYIANVNCGAAPVRVKTHTEVIDHYQVYRPVTVYEPAGVYSERRVIRNNTCGRCNG